jgi:hypothetical protein
MKTLFAFAAALALLAGIACGLGVLCVGAADMLNSLNGHDHESAIDFLMLDLVTYSQISFVVAAGFGFLVMLVPDRDATIQP